jgi:hypothetical protein
VGHHTEPGLKTEAVFGFIPVKQVQHDIHDAAGVCAEQEEGIAHGFNHPEAMLLRNGFYFFLEIAGVLGGVLCPVTFYGMSLFYVKSNPGEVFIPLVFLFSFYLLYFAIIL